MKTSTLSLRYPSVEYNVTAKAGMLEVIEYRSIKCFRSYRDVQIKPVTMTRDEFKTLLAERHANAQPQVLQGI